MKKAEKMNTNRKRKGNEEALAGERGGLRYILRIFFAGDGARPLRECVERHLPFSKVLFIN